jgi:hypothetical protein
MTTTQSGRRENKAAIQAILGVIGIGIWIVFDGALYPDGSIAESMVTALPMFIAYEVGVFSRFIPGLDWLAKRLP